MENEMDRINAIEELLMSMEDILEQAKNVPLSDKVVVDRDALLDIITDIRLKMPSEIEQSKWVLDEKARIIEEAKRSAEEKIQEAEQEAARLVDEDKITADACAQAERIVAEAKRVARDMRVGAKEYAADILTQIEDQLTQLDRFTQSSMRDMANTLDSQTRRFSDSLAEKIEVIAQNRNELNVD